LHFSFRAETANSAVLFTSIFPASISAPTRASEKFTSDGQSVSGRRIAAIAL
jgi:hypothetical protein